ncbi:MAG TPA: Crp/Fnr family transcriptional regulator [Thermoanaerobaculia bacterium]
MKRRKTIADETSIRPTTENRLLELVPAADRARIAVKLERTPLEFRQVMFEEGKPIRYVYFPIDAVVSLLTVMEDGAAVEVGTIGSEGMVGMPLLLGASTSPGLAFAQIVGESWRMAAEDFLPEVRRGGAFSDLLHRYMQYFFIQVSQSTACNRLHPAEERCARWLLQSRERVGKDDFPLTHEFLGQMLGVRRATVTIIAGALQQAGLIEYRRGVVRILDVERLEEASCECYQKVRDEYARVIGPQPPRNVRG